MRPSAASSHTSSAPSNPAPWSQIQRSACWVPQLWPTMPRHPSSLTSRSPARTTPSKRASGYGLSSFVFGTGARYIQSRGRWKSASCSEPNVSSHEASSCSVFAVPATRPSSNALSPIRMYAPSGADTSAVVTFDASGPSAFPSNSVNHSDPCGSCCECLWTV